MLSLICSDGLSGGRVQLGDAARDPEQRAPLLGVLLLRNPEQQNPEQPALDPEQPVPLPPQTHACIREEGRVDGRPGSVTTLTGAEPCRWGGALRGEDVHPVEE